MKVLHVIASVAQVRGGTSRAVLDMVRALRSSGIDADIATTNDADEGLLDVSLNQRVIYQQVPIYFFSRFSPNSAAIRDFAISNPLGIWLWQNISNYDLVHVHALFSYPCTLAMLIARLKNIPYVVAPHGLLCHWSLQQSTQKKTTYLRLIERSNLNNSKGLHLNSQFEQTETLSLALRTKSFIIPHGLDVPATIPNASERLRIHLNLPEDEPVILFLSRLHPKKGLDHLITSLVSLQHCRFTLVIAGTGDSEYETELNQLISTSGLANRTQMVGFVEGEIKDLLLQGSDLFTLTSHSENFGVAVLEALASGLPVVVTPGVALSQLVDKHRLGLVPKLNKDAIATAIAHYLNKPDTSQTMGDRARHFILEHYTWDKIAAHLIQTYQAILTHQPLPQMYS